MYRGITAINVDSKGRLAVPTRYRAQLIGDANPSPDSLVVTIDTEEPCLLLYPMEEWEVIEAKIEALPSFNRAARRIQRLLIGHATELELDGNGRILLPALLRDYASIDKKARLVGQGKKFEIWSEENWDGRCKTWLEAESLNDALPPELQSLSL